MAASKKAAQPVTASSASTQMTSPAKSPSSPSNTKCNVHSDYFEYESYRDRQVMQAKLREENQEFIQKYDISPRKQEKLLNLGTDLKLGLLAGVDINIDAEMVLFDCQFFYEYLTKRENARLIGRVYRGHLVRKNNWEKIEEAKVKGRKKWLRNGMLKKSALEGRKKKKKRRIGGSSLSPIGGRSASQSPKKSPGDLKESPDGKTAAESQVQSASSPVPKLTLPLHAQSILDEKDENGMPRSPALAAHFDVVSRSPRTQWELTPTDSPRSPNRLGAGEKESSGFAPDSARAVKKPNGKFEYLKKNGGSPNVLKTPLQMKEEKILEEVKRSVEGRLNGNDKKDDGNLNGDDVLRKIQEKYDENAANNSALASDYDYRK